MSRYLLNVFKNSFGDSSRLSVSASSIASINKVCRLRSAISARLTGLHYQFIKVLGSPVLYQQDFDREVSGLKSLLARLDNNNVIDNSAYQLLRDEWKQYPANLENHCILLFGRYTKKVPVDYSLRLKRAKDDLSRAVEKRAPQEFIERLKSVVSDEEFFLEQMSKFVERMKVGLLAGRKTELLARLGIEIEQRYQEGWFFVFNTLTVASEHFDKVFPSDSRSSAWTDYIRFCDRYFGITSFGSWRYAQAARKRGNEFHMYFAVVERGSLTGRLHIHVLHMFRDLPEDFADPNLGAAVPRFREISAMRSFWKYGFSSPVAVRFSCGDSFARKGWRWPVFKLGDSFEELPSKSFGSIIGYVGKYISKDIGPKRSKEEGCIWRTRISRRLGMSAIQSRVGRLPIRSRIQLLKTPVLKLSLGQSRVPRLLLRRLLLRSLPVRSLVAIYYRALKRIPLSMCARFRALIQGILVCSPPNCGDTAIRNSRLRVVFDVFRPGSFLVNMAGPAYAV